MEDVLKGMSKVIIDGQNGAGVVPYLPLPPLDKGARPATPPAQAQGVAQ
jgi:hypothetical protein